MADIYFITDPLLTTMGAVRPALLLAKEFRKSGYRVTLVTPRFDPKIQDMVKTEGISIQNIGPNFSFVSSFPTLDAWARCLVRQKITSQVGNSGFIINTSSCIMARAHVYYAQGPMTRTLDDISPGMPVLYKHAYLLLKPTLRALERNLVARFRYLSELFIANSEFCASMYKQAGIEVNKVINPPMDCLFFRPTTAKPAANYVLTHFGVYGKEGRFSVIKAIADAGVSIKVFGDFSSAPKQLTNHPNIALLNRVSDRELVDLYSNALCTLFAFSHEPFGYIPVESMACGTPVLTYNRQGPSETVIDRKTGWLARNDCDLTALALSLWNKGYSTRMRIDCREKALALDTKEILKKWMKVLD